MSLETLQDEIEEIWALAEKEIQASLRELKEAVKIKLQE